MTITDYQYKGFTCTVDDNTELKQLSADIQLKFGTINFCAESLNEIENIFKRLIDDYTNQE